MSDKRILILGGAGFVGSNLTKKFVDGGCKVTVIDGLLAQTGGNVANLAPISKKIQFIDKKIESVRNLSEIIDSCDLIIDSMAWISHRMAFEQPFYDLKLNLLSHLKLIETLKGKKSKRVIFIGTRSQYGQISGIVDEEAPKVPIDIQGVNKEAAESYFRIYSNIYHFDVVSIRFGNTFGVNMPVGGSDIGLVGQIIRDLILGNTVKVYGKNHRRTFVYVLDLAEVVWRLFNRDFSGFEAFNLNGVAMTIEEFVKRIIKILGKGNYKIEAMPEEISRMNVGNGALSERKLEKFIGKIPRTDFRVALAKTLDYFGRQLNFSDD